MDTNTVIRSVMECTIGTVVSECDGPFSFNVEINGLDISIIRDQHDEFSFTVDGDTNLLGYTETTSDEIDVKYPALIQILGTDYLFLVKSSDTSTQWDGQVIEIMIYNPFTKTVFSYDFPSDYGVTSSSHNGSTPFD